MPEPVFVSYRREDSSDAAGRLKETLLRRFGEDFVFMDTSAIRPGDKWPARLQAALDAARVVLAVIGPGWLKASDAYGMRRIDEPDDWVRKELEHALTNDKVVVPVMIGGAAIPPADKLPSSLANLFDSQLVELRNDYWEQDLELLYGQLKRHTEETKWGRRPYITTVDEIAPRTLKDRQEQLAQLAKFATGDDGYLWLTGGPWIGKTALLAQFFRRCPADVDVIGYFLQRTAADADRDRFLQTVNAQLAFLLDERMPSRREAAGTFRDLWQAASARAKSAGRHLLLVVDALDEDLGPSLGLRSVAALLPRRAGGHDHVLVSSRRHILPDDVSADHPLRHLQPVPLDQSPHAALVESRLGMDLKELLRRKNAVLSRDLLGLLTAAGGPLSPDDLLALTRVVYPRTRLLEVLDCLDQDIARVLEPMSDAGPQRLRFAHETLSSMAEVLFGTLELNEYRDRLHDWAQRYADDRWPSDAVPRYLLDSYPALVLRTAPERLADLYGDLAYVETAIAGLGVALVAGNLHAAATKERALWSLSRVLRREAHNLRSRRRVKVPGYVSRQLCLQAMQSGAEAVAERAREYLRRLPPPQLVPGWTSSRIQAALMRILDGHSDAVIGVAISADATRAVSASEDRTVRVWDLRSGETLREIALDAGPHAVAMSADGRRVLSGGKHGELLVWELTGADSSRELKGHAGRVVVAVNEDGTRAVSGGRGGDVRIWDLNSSEPLHCLQHHGDWVTAVAMSADGRRAVSIGSDERHLVWDIDSGEIVRGVVGHASQSALAINGDGSLVMSNGSDGAMRVWNAESGATVRPLESPSGTITAVAMNPAASRAVSASYGGTLQIWDLRTGRAAATLHGHVGAKTAVAVNADASRAVSGGEDRTLRVWDVDRGCEPEIQPSDAQGASGVSMCAGARRAVSGGSDGTPRVWDVEKGDTVQLLEGHSRSVTAIAMNALATRALSANELGELWAWELPSGAGHMLPKHEFWVTAVAMTADGKRGVSASHDCTLRVWDLDAGKILQTFQDHHEWVTAVAITPDGTRAVSGAKNHTLRHWTLDDGRVLHSLSGHAHAVTAAAITSDGRHAISGCAGGMLIVWDLETGATKQVMRAHADAVSAVAIHDDCDRAVSAGADQALLLWDLSNGDRLGEFVSIPPAVDLCLGPQEAGERKLLTAGGPSGVTLYTLLESRPGSKGLKKG